LDSEERGGEEISLLALGRAAALPRPIAGSASGRFKPLPTRDGALPVDYDVCTLCARGSAPSS
jgi:hypothetical protein